jgi:hypothetical protein
MAFKRDTITCSERAVYDPVLNHARRPMATLLRTFVRRYKQVKADWDKGAGEHSWIVPLNRALENVCQNNASHADPAHVYAKVRLINRAYSANLERNQTVVWPEWEVASAFAKGAEADRIIRPLRSVRILDRSTLRQVVISHTELMELAGEGHANLDGLVLLQVPEFSLPQNSADFRPEIR